MFAVATVRPRRVLNPCHLLLPLAVALAGCTPYPFTPYPPHVSPALGEMRDGHATVRLLYATDRRPTGVKTPTLYYGVDRSGEVSLGRCDVSIPPGHGRGRLESPVLGLPARAEKHVAIESVPPPLSREEFVAALREQVAESPRREVFVFVHGYYTSFADAVRLTAQIAHDADFEGVAIAYSWPSEAWLTGYLIDGVNAEWTVPHLTEFLSLLAAESGAEHIHIMAHSMGTRALVKAIRELMRDTNHAAPLFDQIVLCAADVDVDIFERDYLPHVAASARRVTIYVSRADWALGGSQRAHKYARLGLRGPTDFDTPWKDKLDVIDATAVDKGVVGHVYYSRSPTVLADLSGLLRGESPEQRGLQRDGRAFVLSRNDADD